MGGPAPRHGVPPGVHAAAGPKPTWSDEEEGLKAQQQGYSFCTRFKFGIWLSAILLMVAAVVGLSVTMAIIQENKSDGNSSPPNPVDPEGGNGGGSGNKDGYTGPLPVPPTPPPFTVPSGSKAIWWDEFDGTALDSSKWYYDLGNGEWGWGNNESQIYSNSAENVWVEGGKLHLTALREGTAYTSGRINTKNTASFWPGVQLEDGTSFTDIYIEARMQLPTPGQGLWPAFWMFPTEAVYGTWAASGEIDVMESINDMTTITQGLHFGGPDPENAKNMMRTRQSDRSPYSDGFHTYGVSWSLGKVTTYVDGVEAKTFLPREKDPEGGWWTSAANAPSDAPFNQPFYIIMNLAVGGLWPKYPDETTPFPATLTVDYVRVWGTPL